IEVRLPQHVTFGLKIYSLDAIANVIGYIPIGIVLADFGLLRALIGAAALTISAETSQLFMVHRDPSVIDMLTNFAGAFLGVVIRSIGLFRTLELTMTVWKAVAAGAGAILIVIAGWAFWGGPLNSRGHTSPGTIEAHWKLDEQSRTKVIDSSGQA